MVLDPVYGAYLCFASEAAQVAGELDRWGAEYERIRNPEFDAAVSAVIVAAVGKRGRTWRPTTWVWSERDLWALYVEAAAHGSAVVFYLGREEDRWRKGRRVAMRIVATPLAARLTARVVDVPG